MKIFSILLSLFTAASLFAVNTVNRSSQTSRNHPQTIPVFAEKMPVFTVSLRTIPLVKFITKESQFLDSGPSTRWPVLELQYKAKSAQKSDLNALDNVRVEGTLIIESQDENGRRRPAIFTGTMEILTIVMDGKTHMMLMGVPPQLVGRYIREGLNPKSCAIAGRLEIFDENGVKIDTEYGGLNQTFRREDLIAIFKKVDDDPGYGLRIPGGLYPRSATPWGIMDFAKYDIEKPVMPVQKNGKVR